MRIRSLLLATLMLVFVVNANSQKTQSKKGKASTKKELTGGFVSLFNGKDFTNWKVPEGDNGHWKIIDGVIDYDAESAAPGDKSLSSEKSYKDFILYVD